MNIEKTLRFQLENGLISLAEVGSDRATLDALSFLIEEVIEARQEVRRKPWRKNEKPTNREALLEELVDVYKFLQITLAYAGYTSEQFERALATKEQKIQQRLNGDY